MADISETQRRYLNLIAAEPGPVPAKEAFDRLRMSKLSVGIMLAAGVIEKQMIDGRSHYRLTAEGVQTLSETV